MKRGSPIEEFKIRIDEITNAINTLAKHYSVNLISSDDAEARDEINHYVDAYLRECYKNNPYVNFVRQ